MLDESSLASTPQMHDLLRRLGTRDRVVLVGDVRQHQAVDADAQIYTNDTAQLADALSRDVSHRSAQEATRTPGAPSASVDAAVSRHPVAEQTLSQGFER